VRVNILDILDERIVKRLLSQYWEAKLRLIGVGVSKLREREEKQTLYRFYLIF
jgi:hypothetical protein